MSKIDPIYAEQAGKMAVRIFTIPLDRNKGYFNDEALIRFLLNKKGARLTPKPLIA